MKKLFLKKIFMMVGLTFVVSSYADQISVGVHGMVCSFCAQGITKKLNEETSVKSVNVSLENHLVTLVAGKELSDEKIKTIITDAGYKVSDIKRTPSIEEKDRTVSSQEAKK